MKFKANNAKIDESNMANILTRREHYIKARNIKTQTYLTLNFGFLEKYNKLFIRLLLASNTGISAEEGEDKILRLQEVESVIVDTKTYKIEAIPLKLKVLLELTR